MRRILPLAALFLGLFAFADPPAADSEEGKALAIVNRHRKAAGLEAVELDPALSKGCQAHADYLARNAGARQTAGLGAHDESASLPGYTKDGKAAAQSSVISRGESPSEAAEGFMATLYHRVPILDPTLKRIGIGKAKDSNGWITVMDVARGVDEHAATKTVVYPGEDQQDVRIDFGTELPTPIPDDQDRKAGFPVTATFPPDAVVKGVSAWLKDAKGKTIPTWNSSPEMPCDARFQANTVCLIAKDPLLPDTEYSVRVAATVDGKEWSKTWKFRTAAQRK